MAVPVPDTAASFWADYGNTDLLEEIECEGPGKDESLAAYVVKTYGLSLSSKANSIGGSLYGLDIKHMDAMAVINLSLLEALAEVGGSIIYEVVVDEYGDVDFIEVGGSTAHLNDIYYQVQTATYVEECSGVIVRGGKPRPYWYDTEWLPIWGEGDDSSKLIYDATRFMSNCSNPAVSTHAVIVFNDPHLDGKYKDGINNLYELEDPFLRIMGYATHKYAPGSTKDTSIVWSNDAKVEVVIAGPTDVTIGTSPPIFGGTDPGPNIGTLVQRPTFNKDGVDYGASCWLMDGEEIDPTVGIKVNIDEKLRFENRYGEKVDKFQKIEEIYVIAQALSFVKSCPYENDRGAVSGNPADTHKVLINLENPNLQLFKLDPGEDYVIMYTHDESGYITPYVVFAKNTNSADPIPYGRNTPYIIGQGGNSGRYDQGKEGLGCILPIAGGGGYLIHQVIALVTIETPSIVIYDPEFNGVGAGGFDSKAINIANNFVYLTRPLVLYEPPASIAFNGDILDQRPSERDNDPTTKQDFENTPLELAMDAMAAGPGMDITLPFLNNPEEDDVKLATLSKSLYEFMNNEMGITTTYVCGPKTSVALGELGPSGGVVNSITYSYNDSSSYTISVHEGPRLTKPLSGGNVSFATPKADESINVRGTVIQALGNGVHFKVHVDGLGERLAICTCHDVIREGDIVSCSVVNNPVEV